MSVLLAGILIWSLVHFSIRLTPGLRASLIARVGHFPYQGIFSLAMLAGLFCIISGWKMAGPGEPLYFFPWAKSLSLLLMALAAWLFIAARAPTDIKQVLRHPQLSSVMLWSMAHLLANGDTRSLVLFGGLGLWALIEIRLINRAEGEWKKPPRVGAAKTGVSAVIGLAVFAGLLYAHPWLSGVALF
mgnify:FL=1